MRERAPWRRDGARDGDEPGRIYAAALQAAGSIAGDGSTIRVLAGDEEPETFTVVAAKGGDEGVIGDTVSLSILPGGSATG